MLSIDQAKERAADLVSRAIMGGADAADVVYVGNGSKGVQMRLGLLEDVESAEGEEIGLRVFVGKQSASSSSSDFSSQALDALAERGVAMAREAPEDAYAGLAPEDRLMRESLPELDIFDPTEVSPKQLRERALAAEDAARAVSGITNSEGGSASLGSAVVAIATSHGFAGGYAGSSHSTSVSVLAGEGADMQRDYAYCTARFLGDLDDAEAIGRDAAARTLARLNPVKMKSGPMSVAFDPRVGNGLLGHLAGAISGSSIARKTSFLIDKLEKSVFAKGVNVIDDPLRKRGLRSKPFDGEGLKTEQTHLIKDGVLTGWLLDSASARQLGLQPTGHAARGIGGPPSVGTTNMHLAPGTLSRDELIADIKLGFYVTELIGQGVNLLTGDYSRGASGFVIRDGVIAEAVAEVTIAGNLTEMFAQMTPANDLDFHYATNTPTVRIDGMTLAGD